MDYGKENQRLHYHVLEAWKKEDPNMIEEMLSYKTDEVTTAVRIGWNKYGFSESEIIRYNTKSYKSK